MGFLTMYEEYTDDYGRPMPLEEGRAAWAAQKHDRRQSISAVRAPKSTVEISHRRSRSSSRPASRRPSVYEHEYEYTRTVRSHSEHSTPSPLPVVIHQSMPVSQSMHVHDHRMPGSYAYDTTYGVESPEVTIYEPSPPTHAIAYTGLEDFPKMLAAQLTGPGSDFEARLHYEQDLENEIGALERNARIKEDREWLEERNRQHIEEEARRQVKEENKALELALMDQAARRHVNDVLYDDRQSREWRRRASLYSDSDRSETSRRSGRSLSRSASGAKKCRTCHEYGHSTKYCGQYWEAESHDRPRNRIRYYDGL